MKPRALKNKCAAAKQLYYKEDYADSGYMTSPLGVGTSCTEDRYFSARTRQNLY